MLDRTKVVQALNRVSDQLFKPLSYSSWLNRDLWNTLTTNPRFLCSIEEARETQRLAAWEGALSEIVAVPESIISAYSVLAVDGSQIYPDHHLNGVDCFLINAAGCLLIYGEQAKASFFSEPFIYIPEHVVRQFPGIMFSTDCVDLLREDHEFLMLIQQMERPFDTFFEAKNTSDFAKASTNRQGERGNKSVCGL
jgi:hypothetical protein